MIRFLFSSGRGVNSTNFQAKGLQSVAFFSSEAGDHPPIFKVIRQKIEENDCVLFMKGTPAFPQCGFSNAVVRILEAEGLSPEDYESVNVLENEEIRQGIKEFSDWPTIPQLYLKGDFVGGCDILMDMYKKKELTPLFEEAGFKQSSEES